MAWILRPTSHRKELAKGLHEDVGVLRAVMHVLQPSDEEKQDERSGEHVQTELGHMLTDRLAKAPRVGKGARRRHFIEHVRRVAKNYARGLFTCYDHPELARTTNAIESLHGKVKQHLRGCTGRGSTAGGIAQTIGEWLSTATMKLSTLGTTKLEELTAKITKPTYKAARKEQRTLNEPARRYRSLQRNRDRFLREAEHAWTASFGENS